MCGLLIIGVFFYFVFKVIRFILRADRYSSELPPVIRELIDPRYIRVVIQIKMKPDGDIRDKHDKRKD